MKGKLPILFEDGESNPGYYRHYTMSDDTASAHAGTLSTLSGHFTTQAARIYSSKYWQIWKLPNVLPPPRDKYCDSNPAPNSTG